MGYGWGVGVMAGIIQDNMMFPILELIRGEIRKSLQSQATTSEADPFEGVPSASLYREHPLDPDILTRVHLEYPSGYVVDVYLYHGFEDISELPDGFNESDHDWEYVTKWMLRSVRVTSLNTEEEIVMSLNIRLIYDSRWLLTETEVNKLY